MPAKIEKSNDGWSIREAWDAETGKRITSYFYKRKRAPRIELKSKRAQQMSGYALIEKDLRNVEAWLREIAKRQPKEEQSCKVRLGEDREVFNLIKGLFVASLSFYGKCFSRCEGRRIKLDKTLLDKKYRDAHEEVMNLRNNFAAHSGADNFEEVKIALVLNPSRKKYVNARIYRELSQPDLADGFGDGVMFADLVEHARDKVWEKIRKVDQSIIENEVEPRGEDYWYSRGRR